jgi:hypothetical protein
VGELGELRVRGQLDELGEQRAQLGVEGWRWDLVDEQRAELDAAAANEALVQLERLLHGDLGGEGDEVQEGAGWVGEEAGQGVDEAAQGAAGEQVAEDLRHVEEHQRVAGGVEVDEDRAPARSAPRLLALEQAQPVEHGDLSHRGRRPKQALQGPVAGDRAGDPTDLHLFDDVVDDRLVEVEVGGPHLAVRGDGDRLVADLRDAEDRLHARAVSELDDQRALSATGCLHREGGDHGRLADAALAGEQQQPTVEEVLQRGRRRRRGCG